MDHTLLKPEAGEQDIRVITTDALEYRFAAVCVNSCWISLVRKILDDASANPGGSVDAPVAAVRGGGFPVRGTSAV
ncbi:deoxyribose-phosphate aldolase, partial [mine drainage metagenome]